MRTWINTKGIFTRIGCALSILFNPFTLVKTDKGKYIIKAPRKITVDEGLCIVDYLSGKRFMTRYHNGYKKEKPVREKKVRKSRPALSNHTEGC